jgi:hypothetical protein
LEPSFCFRAEPLSDSVSVDSTPAAAAHQGYSAAPTVRRDASVCFRLVLSVGLDWVVAVCQAAPADAMADPDATVYFRQASSADRAWVDRVVRACWEIRAGDSASPDLAELVSPACLVCPEVGGGRREVSRDGQVSLEDLVAGSGADDNPNCHRIPDD